MIDVDNTVFLDFESRSAAKLGGKDGVGAWRYSIDPSTKVLCLAYALGNGEVNLWHEGQKQPDDLAFWIRNGKRIRGWNAQSFERAIFENQCKKKMGWTAPALEQYDDTMLDALTLALPAKLEECAKAIGLENQKAEIGKKLIQKLCKPITAGKKKGLFREKEEFFNDYIELYSYCKQDVRTERELAIWLPRHLEGREKLYSIIVAKMNERGLPIDVGLIDAILEGLKYADDIIGSEFYDLTNIDSPTQREKFRYWLAENGLSVPNLQADTVADLIESGKLSPKNERAIHLYHEANTTSTAKYPKLKEMLCPDNRVRNNLIFNKASTGRLAGAGFQGQNLPAGSLDKTEYGGADLTDPMIHAFLDREFDFIDFWCGIKDAAKKLIRSSIKAAQGKKLISGDLKGIEARGTAFVAGELKMLDNFAAGIDAYVSTAADMYGVPTAAVDKKQRSSGKICVLSGGFGGGYRAQMRMAKKQRMNLTEDQAKKNVRDFRRARPLLVAMWDKFGDAAVRACMTGDRVYVRDTGKLFYFYKDPYRPFLYMVLPSGRHLSFPFPEVRNVIFFGKPRTVVTAMWIDSSPGSNHKWMRREISGPSFFQSSVQAMCRDLLFESHVRAEDEVYPLILSVHDEGLSEVPDDPSFSAEYYDKVIMSKNEIWCFEPPVESDCWEGYRYKK